MGQSRTKAAVIFAVILLLGVAQPVLAVLTPAQDIVSASLTSDATTYSFSMTLLGAPGGAGSTDYAVAYGIFLINAAPNPPGNMGNYFTYSGIPSNIDAYMYTNYVSPGTTDSVVFGKYKGLMGDLSFDSPSFNPMPTFSANGSTLTWTINKSQLASGFSWLAATYGNNGLFLDKSNVALTPIPNAIWLFGSGVVALVGLKRRKSKA